MTGPRPVALGYGFIMMFAAASYGQRRRFSIEFPSLHREAPTWRAGLWARYRLLVT